jgi:tetratricopeptide (TPR) repeat protein
VLNKLRAKFPYELQWSERLGFINYQNHDMSSAFSVLVPMLDKGLMDQMNPVSVLIAAEAAYVKGDNDKAIEILEKVHESQPNDMVTLNNLVYSLAQNPKTLVRAQTLLPRLLAPKLESAAVFDTAATVYFKAGKIKQAAEFTRKALKLVRPGDHAEDEIHLNAAEVFIRIGDLKEARAELDIVSRIGKRSRGAEARRRALVSALGKK